MVTARVSRGYEFGRLFCLMLSGLLLAYMVVPGSAMLPNQALAQGPCAVTDLNPHTAPNGSTTGFAFTIEDDNDSLAWIEITSPSGNLEIVNAQTAWFDNATNTSSTADFYGNPIGPGNPIQVGISASIGNFPPGNWTVQASTDSGGASPMTCSGDTSVSVLDTTPPNITGISASASTTSATIHWTTDKQTTGSLDYGKTSSYGRHIDVNSLSTSHTVTLTSLTPSTIYHYQINVVDQSSNPAQSDDSTFLTATPQSSGGSNSGEGTVTNPSDKTPPTVRITSNLPKTFTAVPAVSGVATDNDKIAQVQFSTNGGQDWLPVDSAAGIGTKSVSFTFKPINLEDGTYALVVRAIDGGGNIAKTKTVTIVIDRLPPVVGGNVIALGPQVLIPNGSGVIKTLTGVSLSLHTSTTGGATSLSLSAMASTATSNAAPSFALQRSPDSGLWNGELSFTTPGTYSLVAHAIDGANNKTSRTIGTVQVGQPGRVLSTNGPINRAVVTAYYRDPDTNGWVVWNGLPYGQTNPQTTGADGSFQMFLPPGTYYLRVSASGYQDLTTSSFSLSSPTPLTTILHMTPTLALGPVGLGWLNLGVVPFVNAPGANNTAQPSTSLIGKGLGTLNLGDTTGFEQSSISWLGKPTLVTVMSTWVPAAAEQIGALEHLSKSNDINVEVIGLQENTERLRAYDAIAGSSLVWIADPDSQSVSILNPTSLPMHYFIDRKGTVQQISYGVLSYQQLLDTLTNLP